MNPLYTPRELEHQLKDSGAKAIVIMENFGTTLQQCIANNARSSTSCSAAMGDRLGLLKGALVNYLSFATSRSWCLQFNIARRGALQ